MTARLVEIWKEFKQIKREVRSGEKSEYEKIRVLYKIFKLRGQHREALRTAFNERNYQQNYRDRNREKLRSYHAEYARIRRQKQRLEKEIKKRNKQTI